LERFPRQGALELSVELIRRLSPDSLSVMEFKSEVDISIARKMLRFPLLGEKLAGTWNITFTREFHMTDDNSLFQKVSSSDTWPLYEGKMLHQYTSLLSEPRYWTKIEEGRNELLRREMYRVEEAINDFAISQPTFRSLGREKIEL
jgi:hypothetical protein